MESLTDENTHFYRIREEGGSGCPPPIVHLKPDEVTDILHIILKGIV